MAPGKLTLGRAVWIYFAIMRALLISLFLASCLQGAAPAADTAVEHLAGRLTGNFSNELQARTDFNYRDVVLHIVRIWTERSDGPWLYLEQALANAPTLPYRQQVYHLVAAAGGSVEVRVSKLPDPIALTAAWREPQRFSALSPDSLVACNGCTLHLTVLPDGSMKGATDGCTCASEIGSAAYATTELTVAEHELVFWDRGFNSAGTQVWGPAYSGYVFKRLE
jgi:CpeT protein